MTSPVISVEHLTKQYDLGVIGTGTLSRDLNRWWARLRKQPDPYTRIGQRDAFERIGETILALDDVSFQVQQGEALGIIGRNGAGKSTLLKILSRVTAPTSGVVKVRGRIGSLLEVGTGFHPELTGRENVYLNGAILGMKKAEVARKFDEIVDFSGVEKFIDTPVKRYSSGMYVRLAFAVAAHLDPEILIVDEVLAVGDAEFQKKCLGKMDDVAGEGRTVLFVSHNMGAIKDLCNRAILFNKGSVDKSGDVAFVVNQYLTDTDFSKPIILKDQHHKGTGSLLFYKTYLTDIEGKVVEEVFPGKPFNIVAEYEIDDNTIIDNPYFAIAIKDDMGTAYTDLWNQGAGYSWKKIPLSGKIICQIPKCPFNTGNYFYSLFMSNKGVALDWISNAGILKVGKGDYYNSGYIPSSKSSRILIDHSWVITRL